MEWELVTLDKLGTVSRGKSKHRPRNDKILFGGKYPFIQTAEVKAAELYINEYSNTYSEKGLEQSKLWPAGTLCITIAANIADTAILGVDACFPDSVMGFIPFKDVANVKFVKYAFDILQRDCQKISQGTAQDNLSWKKLSTIKFPAPAIEIQNKIVDILSAYDDLIENNKKQIKLLEEAAQRLYKEWFVDLHFPQYASAEVIDGVPEGWKRTKIGEFLHVRSGYAFKSSWWQDTGYPVVKIKNIVNNTIDTSNIDYVSPGYTQKIPEFKLHKGDIVIAMTGATIGKIGLIPDVQNLYTNQRVGKVFYNKELINPVPFVFCYYSQKCVLDQIIALSSSSSAQPNISGEQLENLEIIANVEMINKFGQVMQPAFDTIICLYKQIQLLIEARDRLLPKLMSGEIEV